MRNLPLRWVVEAADLAESDLILSRNAGGWPTTFQQLVRIAAGHGFHVEEVPALPVLAMFVCDRVLYRRRTDDARFLARVLHEIVENCIVRGDIVIPLLSGANTAHVVAVEVERRHLIILRFVMAGEEALAVERARQEAERAKSKPDVRREWDEWAESVRRGKYGTA